MVPVNTLHIVQTPQTGIPSKLAVNRPGYEPRIPTVKVTNPLLNSSQGMMSSNTMEHLINIEVNSVHSI